MKSKTPNESKNLNTAQLEEIQAIFNEKIGSMEPAKILALIDKMQTLARKGKNKKYLALAELSLSKVHRFNGEKENCFKSLNKALDISKKVNDPELFIQVYKQLAFAHSLLESAYEKAMAYYEKALEVAIEHEFKSLQASLYDNIGIVHQANERQFEANQCFLKSIALYKEIGKEHLTTSPMHNMAFRHNHPEKALEILNEAIRINTEYKDWMRLFLNYFLKFSTLKKLNRSNEGHQAALKARETFEKARRPVYDCISSFGVGESNLLLAIENDPVDQKLLANAEKWSDHLSTLVDQVKIPDFKVRDRLLKGRILYYQNKPDAAIAILSEAKKIMDSSGVFIDKYIELEVFEMMHLCYQKKGDYKNGYPSLQAYFEFKQQLTKTENERNARELQTKYETTKKEAEVNRLQELEKMKSRFFSQITHELRTPLTLILGPAQQIIDLSPVNPLVSMNAGIIEQNANRLLQLVNQLLDISKLEAGKMGLNKSFGQLELFIESVINAFSALATMNQIQLDLINEMDITAASFDSSALEKILFNLLSNAFKFTPKQGRIVCLLSSKPLEQPGMHQLLLKISDTGIGISEEKLPFIFDRFYQAENSDTRTHEGSGIGLSLVKELIELMEGTIEVKSKLGKGTSFDIQIPLETTSKDHIDIVEGATKLPVVGNLVRQERKIVHQKDTPVLLMIEDNKDIQDYTRSIFEEDYVVLQCYNGIDGVKLARERLPDLIISDVMMPGKDGFQVCDELKNDELTNHIPIILLTAKTASDSRITAFRNKADAFVSKPFNQKELFEQVKSLIAIRKELHKRYSNSTPQKKIESPETEFMQKVTQIINERIDDPEFGADDLRTALFLSRSQVFRKIKALTGKSASAFIRYVRLTKGHQLLKETNLPITSIAYEVGFSYPSYFTNRFQEEFGYSPTEARA